MDRGHRAAERYAELQAEIAQRIGALQTKLAAHAARSAKVPRSFLVVGDLVDCADLLAQAEKLLV